MKKHLFSLLALIVLGFTLAACDDDPAGPSDNDTTFTATLLPANEVPAVTGEEAGGSGTATLTFHVTKDSYGSVDAATFDVTITANGFPAGTTLTAAHIHPGVAGVNGGALIGFGISAGEVSFPTGAGSFTRQGIALTASQADAIFANPGAFYVNIHTTKNTNGVARGQLARVQ